MPKIWSKIKIGLKFAKQKKNDKVMFRRKKVCVEFLPPDKK